ncbi:MAG: hypothetical protein GY845_35385 [Planctomycetes bacterium]|nr:hypothetical protein [Planctomycetota bacterium]
MKRKRVTTQRYSPSDKRGRFGYKEPEPLLYNSGDENEDDDAAGLLGLIDPEEEEKAVFEEDFAREKEVAEALQLVIPMPGTIQSKNIYDPPTLEPCDINNKTDNLCVYKCLIYATKLLAQSVYRRRPAMLFWDAYQFRKDLHRRHPQFDHEAPDMFTECKWAILEATLNRGIEVWHTNGKIYRESTGQYGIIPISLLESDEEFQDHSRHMRLVTNITALLNERRACRCSDCHHIFIRARDLDRHRLQDNCLRCKHCHILFKNYSTLRAHLCRALVKKKERSRRHGFEFGLTERQTQVIELAGGDTASLDGIPIEDDDALHVLCDAMEYSNVETSNDGIDVSSPMISQDDPQCLSLIDREIIETQRSLPRYLNEDFHHQWASIDMESMIQRGSNEHVAIALGARFYKNAVIDDEIHSHLAVATNHYELLDQVCLGFGRHCLLYFFRFLASDTIVDIYRERIRRSVEGRLNYRRLTTQQQKAKARAKMIAAQRVYFIAHNGGRYDAVLLVQHLNDLIADGLLDKCFIPKDVLLRNGRILSFTILDLYTFRDSYRFLTGSLRAISKSFGIEEVEKGFFPYRWFDDESKLFLSYQFDDTNGGAPTKWDFTEIDPTTSAFYRDPDTNKTCLRPDTWKNYVLPVSVNESPGSFVTLERIRRYLHADVVLLGEIWKRYRNSVIAEYKIDPNTLVSGTSLSTKIFYKLTNRKMVRLLTLRMAKLLRPAKMGGHSSPFLRFATTKEDHPFLKKLLGENSIGSNRNGDDQPQNQTFMQRFQEREVPHIGPYYRICYLDVNSLYPYAMLGWLPTGQSTFFQSGGEGNVEDSKVLTNWRRHFNTVTRDQVGLERIKDVTGKEDPILDFIFKPPSDSDYFGFVCVDVDPPRDQFYAPLPRKSLKTGRLMFTLEPIRSKLGEEEHVYMTTELEVACAYYGYRVKKIHWAIRFQPTNEIFQNFVRTLYTQRLEAKKRGDMFETLRKKLELNGAYGKTIMDTSKFVDTEFIHSGEELEQLMQDETATITSYKPLNAKCAMVTVRRTGPSKKKDIYDRVPIQLGISILAISRAYMALTYKWIEENCLLHPRSCLAYQDTDSFHFALATKEDYDALMTCPFIGAIKLGHYKDEYPNKNIVDFVALAPKTYSMRFEDDYQAKRAKGVDMRLNDDLCLHTTYESVLQGDYDGFIRGKSDTIVRKKPMRLFSVKSDKILLRNKSNKRAGFLYTLPFGHQDAY